MKNSKTARRNALKRRHKNLIHLAIIVAIAWSLYTEGGKAADWLFVCLSVACEVS